MKSVYLQMVTKKEGGESIKIDSAIGNLSLFMLLF